MHRNPVVLSALTGSVVLIDDFEIAGPRWHAFAQSAARSGVGACRVFPLRLVERPLGALAVFTTDPWNSHPRDNAFSQSLADLAAIALSMSDVDGRSEAETVAAQHVLASCATIEQACGVIAELDQVDIYSAMKALAARAQARGMTVARNAEHVVEDPEFR
ncbi:GAF domain-containing protein [Rhodococcus sp. MS16]|uniref:GAF domain-containing protein n=1 Tax=Rhodococcus sp. MS16 TaxID=2579941 RepID=UPI0015627D59|nr:GAF domain-containing protein [Rhodococcus sp. MS16]